jgi:hypothetical protein
MNMNLNDGDPIKVLGFKPPPRTGRWQLLSGSDTENGWSIPGSNQPVDSDFMDSFFGDEVFIVLDLKKQ